MKADWFTSPADLDAPDPFADAPLPFGSTVISLDSSIADLDARIKDLMKREGNLFEMGITCDLKDCAEASCLACPVSKLGDADSPLSALCRIGQEQERVITMRLAKSVSV
jgi:hypothetical protein